VEDEDNDDFDDSRFASSCEESDVAEKFIAACADRSTGRALSEIAALEVRAAAASSRKGDVNAQDRPQGTWTPVNDVGDAPLQRWNNYVA
jgi:hypothetical protein